MNVFNLTEYIDICKKLETDGNITDVTVRYNSPSYFNRIKNVVQWDRRGEVVFCVIRPNGRIIVTTCSDYPKDIYRIPTGGIGHNEDILEAVYREVKEELGLEVKIRSFGGVVRISFEHENDNVMFYSYIFILDEVGGRLLEDASDDEISEIREVDLDGLGKITESLGEIKGKWQDWGQFRYVTSNAVLQHLKRKCI
jgi:ADP-ribose pyrophosphatase YjhB (NUDIX family)